MKYLIVAIFFFCINISAQQKRILKSETIPDGWIVVNYDKSYYTIEKVGKNIHYMVAVTGVPSGYIITNYKPSWQGGVYTQYTIKKLSRNVHHMIAIIGVPKDYIVTSIQPRWQGGVYSKYTIEKLGKDIYNNMCGITDIPDGYEVISEFKNGCGAGISKYTIRKITTNFLLLKRKKTSLFPNPSNGIIFIDKTYSSNSIKMFDMSGRLVFTYDLDAREIDLSSMPKGIYIVLFESGNHIINVEKLVLL